MFDKDYFKTLIGLYEASVRDKGVKGENSGKLVDTNIDDDKIIEDPELEVKNGPGETFDTDNDIPEEDYEFGEFQEDIAETPETDFEVVQNRRQVKLFELFEDLLNYTTTLEDGLLKIDFGLLSQEVTTVVVDSRRDIERLIIKINKYMAGMIDMESYERSLYIYVLLRTELVTIVKILNNALKLDDISDVLEDKST